MGRPKKDQLDTVSFTPFIAACLRLHLPGETISFTVEMLLCSLLGTTKLTIFRPGDQRRASARNFTLKQKSWLILNCTPVDQNRCGPNSCWPSYFGCHLITLGALSASRRVVCQKIITMKHQRGGSYHGQYKTFTFTFRQLPFLLSIVYYYVG